MVEIANPFIANRSSLGYPEQINALYTRESHKVKSVLGRLARIAGRRLIYSGVGVLLSTPFFVASAQASEASLRVAFVYNFLKFIEWPQRENQPISLCALGAEGITRQALAQLEKKSQPQRFIRVVYIDKTDDLSQHLTSCQMIYRPTSGERFPLPEPLPPGALLVADEPDPSDKRVAIALVRTVDNRIEFIIDELAIGHAGVKVSSQLLKLARKPTKERS